MDASFAETLNANKPSEFLCSHCVYLIELDITQRNPIPDLAWLVQADPLYFASWIDEDLM